jgi:hypothetical protein
MCSICATAACTLRHGATDAKRRTLLNQIRHWHTHYLCIGSVSLPLLSGIYCQPTATADLLQPRHWLTTFVGAV